MLNIHIIYTYIIYCIHTYIYIYIYATPLKSLPFLCFWEGSSIPAGLEWLMHNLQSRNGSFWSQGQAAIFSHQSRHGSFWSHGWAAIFSHQKEKYSFQWETSDSVFQSGRGSGTPMSLRSKESAALSLSAWEGNNWQTSKGNNLKTMLKWLLAQKLRLKQSWATLTLRPFLLDEAAK